MKITKVETIQIDDRNFLRPFRGVHKKFLAGYIALCDVIPVIYRVPRHCQGACAQLTMAQFPVGLPTERTKGEASDSRADGRRTNRSWRSVDSRAMIWAR